MNGNLKELAPRPWKLREPIKTKPNGFIDSQYTTAAVGVASLGAIKGWEAITPKPQNKPEPVIATFQAMNKAWDNYLWHIDHEADQGTIESLWWEYDKARAAYYEAAEASEAEYMALYSPEAALSEVRS